MINVLFYSETCVCMRKTCVCLRMLECVCVCVCMGSRVCELMTDPANTIFCFDSVVGGDHSRTV